MVVQNTPSSPYTYLHGLHESLCNHSMSHLDCGEGVQPNLPTVDGEHSCVWVGFRHRLQNVGHTFRSCSSPWCVLEWSSETFHSRPTKRLLTSPATMHPSGFWSAVILPMRIASTATSGSPLANYSPALKSQCMQFSRSGHSSFFVFLSVFPKSAMIDSVWCPARSLSTHFLNFLRPFLILKHCILWNSPEIKFKFMHFFRNK